MSLSYASPLESPDKLVELTLDQQKVIKINPSVRVPSNDRQIVNAEETPGKMI